MTTYPSAILAMLAEMEQATTAIIETHFAADEARPDSEQILKHWAPFSVRVFCDGGGGQIAEFVEEGVTLK